MLVNKLMHENRMMDVLVKNNLKVVQFFWSFTHKYRLIKKLYPSISFTFRMLFSYSPTIPYMVFPFGHIDKRCYQIYILNWQFKMESSVHLSIQSFKLLKDFTEAKE